MMQHSPIHAKQYKPEMSADYFFVYTVLGSRLYICGAYLVCENRYNKFAGLKCFNDTRNKIAIVRCGNIALEADI